MGPLFENIAKDEKDNITFHVMTPERMTPQETAAAVRVYLRMTPRKKWPKKNSDVTFICPVGVLDMGAADDFGDIIRIEEPAEALVFGGDFTPFLRRKFDHLSACWMFDDEGTVAIKGGHFLRRRRRHRIQSINVEHIAAFQTSVVKLSMEEQNG